MNHTETLRAIRVLCEKAPDPDEKLYVGDFERLVTRYDRLVEKVYRLCLDALEPKPQPAPAECYRECDDPSCPYMHTPGPTREGLD